MGNLDRIATYVNWPADTSVSCLSLASSGFVYNGVADHVTCPLCGLAIRISDLRQRTVNDPFNEHRMRSPQCPFFSEESPNLGAMPVMSGRVTSSLHQDSSSTVQSATPDITAVYRSVLERAARHGVIDQPTGSAAASRDTEAGAPAVARIDRANPDYGLLRHESVRLSTFDDWPASDTVQPSALARAGLFYTGRADRAGCAFCRGVLHHWQPRDDPTTEHRRHFPDCPFVRQQDVGNVPLRRDTSPDRQMAALAISDVSHSTSGDHSSCTVSAAARTSSNPGEVVADNRQQIMDHGQELAAGRSEHQTLEQQTTETVRITNTLGESVRYVYCFKL